MKQFYFLCLHLLMLTACNNVEDKKDNTVVKPDTIRNDAAVNIDTTNKLSSTEATSNEDSSTTAEFKLYKMYGLKDTIKADFNGDKILDFAYLTQNDNKGIFIVDGRTKNKTNVGLDQSFGDMGSQFNWVDFWGTTDDPETFEILIEGDEIVGEKKTKLDNTSLFLRKEEVGGGVITYKDGRYIWIHQSD